jgi:hypothetical protein
MSIRTLILILACSVCSIAAADMVSLEEGIESSTSDVRLPGNSSGYIVLRSCPDCIEVTLSLSAGTRYSVNGKSVEYKDFRSLSLAAGNSLNIYYDPNSNSVTRMRLRGHF